MHRRLQFDMRENPEEWIEQLDLAPMSKGHVRTMMHILFRWAMKWALIEVQINPMSLVHVECSSKRMREPITLTVEQFHKVLEFVKEPFRIMCIVAICLGLRASELVGLQWNDFDWTAVLPSHNSQDHRGKRRLAAVLLSRISSFSPCTQLLRLGPIPTQPGKPLARAYFPVSGGEMSGLLQLRVFCFGSNENWNVRVGIFPERQEILIGGLSSGHIALQSKSAC